jgi:hypothetical protein
MRPALFAVVVCVAALAGSVHAQHPPEDVEAPGEASEHAHAVAAARAMLQDDVSWIAARTGWRIVSVPAIETRTDRELSMMFFGIAEQPDGMTPLALYGREVHILYISDRLTFDNLIDRSILLHELVHHMQVLDNVRSGCREAEEAQAYKLQVDWLVEHGVADPYALLGIAKSDIDGLVCP